MVSIASENEWEVFAVSGGNLVVNRRACRCGFSSLCAWDTVGSPIISNVVGLGAPSAAYPGGPRAYAVADTSSGRTESCYHVITYCPTFCPLPPPELNHRTSSHQLHVARRPGTTKIIGAQSTTSTTIDLLEKDLGPGCSEPWIKIGTAPVSSPTKWRPVMLGTKPGILYIEGNNLKVWH
jgi:hypothetical protein